MRSSIFLLLLFVALAVAVLTAYGVLPRWAAGVAGVFGLVCIFFLYRSVVLPGRIVQTGFSLLKAQETNNRLHKTGIREADRIVELFNSLMTTLQGARRRLREQEQMFTKLTAAAPMGILVLDLDYHVEETNRAFRQFLSVGEEDDILGKRLNEIDSTAFSELASMKPGEVRLMRPEGRSLLRCRRLWFMQSGFRQTFYIVENLGEEVARAEKEAYGKVVRLISHEVNNNMAGILPLLEELSVQHAGERDMTEWIGSVAERSRNLGKFIDSYANVVRLPAPRLKPVSLDGFLRRLRPFLESVAVYPLAIELSSSADDRFEVSADVAMLEQALVNIVVNARQAIERRIEAEELAEEEAFVRLTLGRDERNDISLVISNNGEPIGAEQGQHLFTPFYSSRPGGQGIGLTLVSEILSRHNVRFTLSTDSDAFTRFRLHWRLV